MADVLGIGLIACAFALILFGAFHVELFILNARGKKRKNLSREEKIYRAVINERLPVWVANLIIFAGAMIFGLSKVIHRAFFINTAGKGFASYGLNDLWNDFLLGLLGAVVALPIVWLVCYALASIIPDLHKAMVVREKASQRSASHSVRTADSSKSTSRYKAPSSAASMKAKAQRITKELRAEVYESENDWDTLFHFPALQDMSVPQTAKFYQLFRELSEAELMADDLHASHTAIRAFLDCAQKATQAWKYATSHAREVGLTYLDTQKAADAATAIRLLPVIDPDSGASENERQTAYARLERIARSLGFQPAVTATMLDGAAMRSMITDGNE
ncbi:MAG: hypothetical protein PUK59_02600 [Actinomycetaceae bacterium]|nr:hypothetical protein [Actinomycetaceae bacterium]